MNSSTSDSDFIRSALTAFLCGIVTLLVPYEALVRASERIYGVRRANIVMPRTLSPKLDGFMADFENGVRYNTYAVGTSRVEWGLRPDIVEEVAGPTYNAGLGGISSIITIELLDRLDLHPGRIIVSVSPLDFTRIGIRQGERGLSLTRITAHDSDSKTADERGPAAWSRVAFRALFHSSSPGRHRNAGQWLQFWRDHGTLLAFLNNEDAIGPISPSAMRGYRLSTEIAPADVFAHVKLWDISGDYASARGDLTRRLADAIQSFKNKGTEVTLVRFPTGINVRRREDSLMPTFNADMQAFSRMSGVPYVDGLTLVGDKFAYDRRNFADSEHMNSTGAGTFSRALAATLTSRASASDGYAR